jgi:hypothetical protein
MNWPRVEAVTKPGGVDGVPPTPEQRPRDEASHPPRPKSPRWESNWVTSLPCAR